MRFLGRNCFTFPDYKALKTNRLYEQKLLETERRDF